MLLLVPESDRTWLRVASMRLGFSRPRGFYKGVIACKQTQAEPDNERSRRGREVTTLSQTLKDNHPGRCCIMENCDGMSLNTSNAVVWGADGKRCVDMMIPKCDGENAAENRCGCRSDSSIQQA